MEINLCTCEKEAMTMIKKWIQSILTAAFVMMGATVFAYTDDAGIMGKFNYDNSMYMYDYLNSNDYHFYNRFGSMDTYMKNDNSMFMVIPNEKDGALQPGQMKSIIILKPGIATDKGIQVGDTLTDVINAYGKAYDVLQYDIYNNDPNTGYMRKDAFYYPVAGSSWKKAPFKFYSIDYLDRDKHVVRFFVSQSSEKVVAIHYWKYYIISPRNIANGALATYGLWRFILNY